MALAILELLAVEGGGVRFNVDTGTNGYYQLRIGKGVRRRHGIDWVDEVTHRTPVAANQAGGDLLRSAPEVVVPYARFADAGYVQLFSFKTPDGRSPAFSRVVRVGRGFGPAGAVDLAPTLSS